MNRLEIHALMDLEKNVALACRMAWLHGRLSLCFAHLGWWVVWHRCLCCLGWSWRFDTGGLRTKTIPFLRKDNSYTVKFDNIYFDYDIFQKNICLNWNISSWFGIHQKSLIVQISWIWRSWEFLVQWWFRSFLRSNNRTFEPPHHILPENHHVLWEISCWKTTLLLWNGLILGDILVSFIMQDHISRRQVQTFSAYQVEKLLVSANNVYPKPFRRAIEEPSLKNPFLYLDGAMEHPQAIRNRMRQIRMLLEKLWCLLLKATGIFKNWWGVVAMAICKWLLFN